MSDIGTERLSWSEFNTLVAWLPPLPSNALYRAMNPKSWYWTPEFDMYSLMIHALQGANWQRGGGQGDRPTFLERPKEADELSAANTDNQAYDLSEIREELARRQRQPEE
ncbi:hypothetical protein ACFU44_00360 [Nocardia rhizosphaerihabitans]|uniref:hypothetical protein n=1 Tax=Nocardia rhizosphaerihabitans TaxID=1691570 RepID=UPI0036718FD2